MSSSTSITSALNRVAGRLVSPTKSKSSISANTLAQNNTVCTSSTMSAAPKLLVLLGTQSFTAERLSDRLGDLLEERFEAVDYEVHMIDEYDYEGLLFQSGVGGDAPAGTSEEKIVLFLVSTYGVGDPPSHCMQFAQWLKNLKEEDVAGGKLLFSVFGLGSRHYEDFAVFGEFVDSRCAQVGGRRVSPFLRGDSSKDINRDFEKWCSELCKNLARAFPALSHPNPAKPTKKKKLSTSADLFKSTRRFPARESFVVTLIGRDLAMPTPQSSSLVDIDATCTNVDKKTTLHLTFRSETELPSWLQAGDHVGFYPQNGPAQVERACRILGGVDPERREKILLPAKPLGGPAVETEIRLGDILRDEVDLTGHCASPETLRNLVAWITSLELRALARELTHVDSAGPVEEDDVDMIGAAGVSIPRLSKYERWVRNRHLTVLDLMEIFDCQPTVAAFLRVCPRMEPRLYSIATCEQGGVGQVFSLCVALVKYREAVSWRKHFGLASGMLCMGCTSSLGKPGATSAAVTVRMFSRNSGFHLLQNPAIPMIMFAVGSGVGPYVGFLQGRMRSSAMEMNRVVVQQSSAAGADGGQQQALMGHPLKLRRINRVDEDTTMSGALSNEQGGGCDDCSCGQGGGCGTSYGKASLPASQDHVGHSFSHHRLYFGVQDRDSFLYRDFLETISDKTGPHKLNLSMAFSREDPTKKHYVQDACLFGWSWADADH